MKKGITFSIFLLFQISITFSQGYYNDNWTLKDLKGNTHTLYDYLDAGKVVIIHSLEYNAAYHWDFHTSGILDSIYKKYGPNGTDQVMVFFAHEIGHPDIPDAYFYGNGGGTRGNWVDAVDYPGLNVNTQFNWDPNFPSGNNGSRYCHLKIICPDHITNTCDYNFIRNPPNNAIEFLEDKIFSCGNVVGPVPKITVVNVDCPNDETGSITLDLTDWTPPVSVYWSNTEQNNGTLSNVPAGEYFATIIDADNRYRQIGPIVIESNSEGIDIELSQKSDADCDGNLGNISINVTSGTAATFEWSNGANTQNISDLVAGTYSVTATNANGCQDIIEDIVINSSEQPVAVAENIVMNCNDTEYIIDGSLSTIHDNDMIEWTTQDGNIIENANELMPTIDQTGTYKLTITSPEGCSSVTEITVAPASYPIINEIASNAEELTCDIPCANITVDADLETNFIIQWSSNDGNISDIENNLTPEICTPGNYELIITNPENGCSSSETIQITQNSTPPDVEITGATQLDCIQTSLELTGNSTSNVTYEWSNGTTVPTTTISDEGNYTLVVTNIENGCKNSKSIDVTKSTDLPEFTIDANPINCIYTESNIVLSTNQTDLSFEWSGPDNYNSIEQNPTISEAGNYQVIVTNSSGCSMVSNIEIESNMESPEIQIEPTSLDCLHPTTSLIANSSTNNLSYQWNTNNGHFVSELDQSNPMIDAPGTYTLLVTNTENGCTASQEITVSESPNIEASLKNITHPLCNGDDTGMAFVDVTNGTAPFQYEWSNGSTNPDLSNVVAGTYSVIITDAVGCSISLPVEISEPDILNTSITSIGESAIGKADGSAEVTVTGGTSPYQYMWNNEATTPKIDNLTPGTYSVTIIDQNGCSTIETVIVSGIDCNINGHIEKQDLTCFESNTGMASIIMDEGTAPFTFHWDNDQNVAEIQDLSAQNYSVTVTDADGCSFITTTQIEQPPILDASANVEDILCAGDDNGSVSIDATGGTPPYTYEWKYGANTATITDKSPGTYEVKIMDANDCKITLPVSITAPNPIEIAPTVSNISSFGKADGTISVSTTGGVEPYTYLWSNDMTTPEITNLDKGAYSVTITDANGCEHISTYEITEPGEVLISLEGTPITCFGENDGEISVVVNQGISPITYLWSNGDTTQTISSLGVGTYTVTVTDGTGGQNIQSYTLTEAEPIENFVLTSNVDCFGDTNGSAKILETKGGTAPYTYIWSNDSTGIEVTNLAAGDYKFTVTDSKGCARQHAISIFTPDEFIANEVIENISENTMGSIKLYPQGGTPPFKFEWSNGEQQDSILNLEKGIYTVTITDKNKCIYVFEYEITGIVATNAVNSDYHVEIYPNPTDGLFYVDLKMPKENAIQFELWSITGQKIEADISELIKNEKYQLQLQNDGSTVFFLKIIFEHGVYTRKMTQIW